MFRVVIRLLGVVMLLLVLLVAGFALTMRACFPGTTLDAQREGPKSE
jgi:hypothetical protein